MRTCDASPEPRRRGPAVKVIVVYESMFGNTHQVAEAVAEGLKESAEVSVHPVSEALPEVLAGADLVVVGGPTHMHGMASKMSHKAAADDAKKHHEHVLDPEAEGPVLREWFDGIGKTEGVRGAAFDTRLPKSKLLTGSAAKGIAKRLNGHGYDVVGEESFIVDDTAGPMHEGELERAREWGRGLAGGA
jgi:multimeric flavodoxin WrbA